MKLKYHLFCLVAICFFSTIELVSKKLGGGISPFSITAWRFLIGGLVILPFAIRQIRIDRVLLNTSSILTMGVLGILNVCVSMLLLQLAIHYGKASLSAILVSTNPLFVSVFASVIIKEKLDWQQVSGLVLGILGLLIIILGEQQMQHSSFLNLPLGIAHALLAALTFGLYTVLTKKTVLRYGNLITNSISFISGALVLFVISMVLGKQLSFEINTRNILSMAYMGIVITGIAYLFYFEGMKSLTAAVASQYFFLKPVIASLLAVFILNERLSTLQIAGIVLVIISLARNTLFRLMINHKRSKING